MAMKRASGNLLPRRTCRILGVVWGLATGGLLLLPGSRLPGQEFSEPWVTVIELLVHVALFWILAWLTGRGFGHRRTLAVVLAYCVVLEIAQIAVPGRSFELVDIAAGGLGAILGRLASR